MNEYLFISDIHGRDPQLEEKLIKIASSDHVPEIVFFLGDIVGTDSLDKLQKLFYNGVYNAAKKAIKEKPQISNTELLNYRNNNGYTIKNGISEIRDFLRGSFFHSESYKANYVRELVQYSHYGHFVSNLPKPIRQNLQKDMENNAKVWIEIMTKFTDKGSMVVIVEGNWDARNPLDFFPTKDICQPTPIKDRSFYFKDLLKSLNDKVLYFDEVGTIETEKEIFVIWPFDIAAADIATQVPEFNENQETKKIVLLSHAQIDWKSVNGDKPMTNEGQKIQDNMPMTFHDVKADTSVHGHLHTDIGTDGYFFEGKFIHYLPKGTCRFIDF